MRQPRDYDYIPGTFVFDGDACRKGYVLNMFCMSLNDADNRDAFRADEAAYLDRYQLTAPQARAVLDRDWLEMLRLGGNIYYTFKLAITDGLTMQQVSGAMSGISGDEFTEMMAAGGRSVHGNRHVGDRETVGG